MSMNESQKKFIILNFCMTAIVIIGVSVGVATIFAIGREPNLNFLAGLFLGLIFQQYLAYSVIYVMNEKKEGGEIYGDNQGL